MKLNSSHQPVRRHRRRVFSISLHFVTAAVFVLLCTALPAFGQTATYSDSWFVDNSPEAYDASIDSYSVTTSQNEVAGVGVTESDYYTDSESVQTTLTAPDGTTATTTSYADPWYSRAEVTLPYTFDENAPPGNEVQYTVDTAHRYYRDPSGGDPCAPSDPRMEMPAQPCYMAKASYNTAATPQFGYFIIFTRYFMTISIRFTSYQLDSISPSRCIYVVDCPEGYTCGYRSIWYYPHPGGSPCDAFAVMGNLLINRRYCINSVYGRLSPVPVPCT
jgi:hypothetical protein